MSLNHSGSQARSSHPRHQVCVCCLCCQLCATCVALEVLSSNPHSLLRRWCEREPACYLSVPQFPICYKAPQYPLFSLATLGAVCEMKVMPMTADDKFHVSCFTVERCVLRSALGSRSSLATWAPFRSSCVHSPIHSSGLQVLMLPCYVLGEDKDKQEGSHQHVLPLHSFISVALFQPRVLGTVRTLSAPK